MAWLALVLSDCTQSSNACSHSSGHPVGAYILLGLIALTVAAFGWWLWRRRTRY